MNVEIVTWMVAAYIVVIHCLAWLWVVEAACEELSEWRGEAV